MTTIIEAPDIEAVVAVTLRNAAISGLSTRVYSSVPTNPTYPLVTVQRIGGVPSVREYLDTANIQIDVWGGTKSEARDIAARARVVLLGLAGSLVSSPVAAWISAVEDALGLSWQPDPVTGRDRYIFAVLVYGRGLEASEVAGYGEGGYGA